MLLTGHKGEEIARGPTGDGVGVECVDTGVDTPTGGRVHALRERLTARFCLTYADGVADIDLGARSRHHARARALATMTVVQPELPFGVGDARRRPRARVPREAGLRAVGQRRLLLLEPGVLEYLARTACSSASRSSASPPTARSPPTATRASGAAWTRLKTDAVALEEAGPGRWPAI